LVEFESTTSTAVVEWSLEFPPADPCLASASMRSRERLSGSLDTDFKNLGCLTATSDRFPYEAYRQIAHAPPRSDAYHSQSSSLESVRYFQDIVSE